MNYLNKMYGSKQIPALLKSSDKNPNRVSGGLRAQGVDTFEMLGEDGSIQRIPTHAYVQSLEDRIKKQKSVIDILERKLGRHETAINNLEAYLRKTNGS